MAVNLKLIARSALVNLVVDSTVQPKAIAHPTDSRLLETARQKLVEAAKESGIALKQTYAQEGKQLAFRASRYAHAKQYRRMRKAVFVNKVVRFSKRPSPFFLATPHARVAGLATLL